MLSSTKRSGLSYVLLSLLCLLLLTSLHQRYEQSGYRVTASTPPAETFEQDPSAQPSHQRFDWSSRIANHPPTSYIQLPKHDKSKVGRVQHRFTRETAAEKQTREERQAAVKQAFVRCWRSYRKHAWLEDELTPVSGSFKSSFGGWAATLVDSLDTLWIMDLRDEFAEAVDATVSIDFTNTTSNKISVFETTIRYLGGMLSAYDLSNDRRLLVKAEELAHTLWAAFDTPNRMPINWWDLHAASENVAQEAEDGVLSAEIGSLSMEFTRLAQLTGDPKWYDAVARIMDIFATQQDETNLPGMWPLVLNAQDANFTVGQTFTLGAMADSLYEYLPKMHALLGGSSMYATMYEKSMDAAISHTLFRPMLPDDADVLFAGSIDVPKVGDRILEPSGQHLGCFVGGMLALGGRLTHNDSHIELGRKVTDGCVWAYEHSPLGIMPESFTMLPCRHTNDCRWDRQEWLNAVGRQISGDESHGAENAEREHLPDGFTSMGDRRYILRPEAIESVFILYRVTGDPELLEKGWRMWQSIDEHTRTELANSAIHDMTDPSAPKSDSMESFWTAETLKYFYLLFSPPDLISLDLFVFNTEAHPLRRPKTGWW